MSYIDSNLAGSRNVFSIDLLSLSPKQRRLQDLLQEPKPPAAKVYWMAKIFLTVTMLLSMHMKNCTFFFFANAAFRLFTACVYI